MASGVNFSTLDSNEWSKLGDSAVWMKLITCFLIIASLTFVKRQYRQHVWVFPVIVCASCAILYTIVFAVFQSADEVRLHGWLYKNDTSGSNNFWSFWTRLDIWNADGGKVFTSIFGRFGDFIMLIIIPVLDMALNLPALPFMLSEDHVNSNNPPQFDANIEFRVAGSAAFVGGTFGSGLSYLTLSPTKINREAGGASGNVSSMICCAILVACFFAGPTLLAFLSPQILGGLLAFAGVDYCMFSLWDSRHCFQLWEWGNVILMVVLSLMTAIGSTYSLLIGGGVGTLVFVIQYIRSSKSHMITSWSQRGNSEEDIEADCKGLIDSGDLRSAEDESHQLLFTHLHSTPLLVLRVKGYLFFGNISKLVDQVEHGLSTLAKLYHHSRDHVVVHKSLADNSDRHVVGGNQLNDVVVETSPSPPVASTAPLMNKQPVSLTLPSPALPLNINDNKTISSDSTSLSTAASVSSAVKPYLLLDFLSLYGLDSTSVESFEACSESSKRQGIDLVIFGLRKESPVYMRLNHVHYFDSPHVHLFQYKFEAMRWIEEQIMTKVSHGTNADSHECLQPSKRVSFTHSTTSTASDHSTPESAHDSEHEHHLDNSPTKKEIELASFMTSSDQSKRFDLHHLAQPIRTNHSILAQLEMIFGKTISIHLRPNDILRLDTRSDYSVIIVHDGVLSTGRRQVSAEPTSNLRQDENARGRQSLSSSIISTTASSASSSPLIRHSPEKFSMLSSTAVMSPLPSPGLEFSPSPTPPVVSNQMIHRRGSATAADHESHLIMPPSVGMLPSLIPSATAGAPASSSAMSTRDVTPESDHHPTSSPLPSVSMSPLPPSAFSAYSTNISPQAEMTIDSSPTPLIELQRYYTGSIFAVAPANYAQHHLVLMASSSISHSTHVCVLTSTHLSLLHSSHSNISSHLMHQLSMQFATMSLSRIEEERFHQHIQ